MIGGTIGKKSVIFCKKKLILHWLFLINFEESFGKSAVILRRNVDGGLLAGLLEKTFEGFFPQ